MGRFSTLKQKAIQNPQRFGLACRLCEGKHPIRLCPIYRAKTPEERLREALLGHFCGNCLSMDHKTDNCTSEARCRQCNEKHHSTLHIDEHRDSWRSENETSKPWSVQIEEEENADCAISICASDSGTETRPLRPENEQSDLCGSGAETRPLRPAMNGDRKPGLFDPCSNMNATT